MKLRDFLNRNLVRLIAAMKSKFAAQLLEFDDPHLMYELIMDWIMEKDTEGTQLYLSTPIDCSNTEVCPEPSVILDLEPSLHLDMYTLLCVDRPANLLFPWKIGVVEMYAKDADENSEWKLAKHRPARCYIVYEQSHYPTAGVYAPSQYLSGLLRLDSMKDKVREVTANFLENAELGREYAISMLRTLLSQFNETLDMILSELTEGGETP